MDSILIKPKAKEVSMDNSQYSIAEAKGRLPSLVHEVEKGSSVVLTRHGKPVAVLLSIHEYTQLSEKKGGFWNALTAYQRAISVEGEEIGDADFEGLRDFTPGRDVE